jgi:hypothetical protein
MISGSTDSGTAGATITPGDWLYKDASAGTMKLCDVDLSEAASQCKGMATTYADSGDLVDWALPGSVVEVGGTLSLTAPGYVASDTAGGMKPTADLTTGDYPCFLGWAQTTARLKIHIEYSSVAAS